MTESYEALPDLDGEPVDPDSAEAVALLAAAGIAGPRQVVIHDQLHVRITQADDDSTDGRDAISHRVPVWVDDAGTVHLARSRP